MSFGISSRRKPTASRAAIFAIGKPVAFDARAEERETRGFISMTIRRPLFGSTANWMFDPPVATPTARITFRASSRIAWYSTSESVICGAIVIESPVWTPIGSRFSMEQTTTNVSATSRITSSSNSFHPRTDSSTRTSWTGESERPRLTIASKSSTLKAIPPPVPPRVNEGRMTTGKPKGRAIACASSRPWARPDRRTATPASSIAFLKRRRSSPSFTDRTDAPSVSMPCFARTPASSSATARFSAV